MRAKEKFALPVLAHTNSKSCFLLSRISHQLPWLDDQEINYRSSSAGLVTNKEELVENVNVLSAAGMELWHFKSWETCTRQTEFWTFRTIYFALFKEHLGRISWGTALASQRGPGVLPYLQTQLSQSRRTVLFDKQKVKQTWQKASTADQGTPDSAQTHRKKHTEVEVRMGWPAGI